jgi:hypothetical protein
VASGSGTVTAPEAPEIVLKVVHEPEAREFLYSRR